MTKILSMVLVFLFLVVACPIVNAQTEVRVGNDLGEGIQIIFPLNLGASDTAGGLFFDDLMVNTAGGSTFTFDYAITPGAGVGSVFSRNGFLAQQTDEAGGSPTSAVNDFDDGDVVNISISDVTNGYEFDGFTNFGSAQTAAGGTEGFFIGGVADPFLRDVDNNGDDDPRFGIALPDGLLAGPSTTFSSVGTVTLRGVALQFSDGTNVVLLGDVNLDTVVNFLDISAFITVLSGGGFQAEADCNEDESVNFLDISPFIGILNGQ